MDFGYITEIQYGQTVVDVSVTNSRQLIHRENIENTSCVDLCKLVIMKVFYLQCKIIRKAIIQKCFATIQHIVFLCSS